MSSIVGCLPDFGLTLYAGMVGRSNSSGLHGVHQIEPKSAFPIWPERPLKRRELERAVANGTIEGHFETLAIAASIAIRTTI